MSSGCATTARARVQSSGSGSSGGGVSMGPSMPSKGLARQTGVRLGGRHGGDLGELDVDDDAALRAFWDVEQAAQRADRSLPGPDDVRATRADGPASRRPASAAPCSRRTTATAARRDRRARARPPRQPPRRPARGQRPPVPSATRPRSRAARRGRTSRTRGRSADVHRRGLASRARRRPRPASAFARSARASSPHIARTTSSSTSRSRRDRGAPERAHGRHLDEPRSRRPGDGVRADAHADEPGRADRRARPRAAW